MTGRVLVLCAGLVCAVIVVCAGLAGAVFVHGAATGCAPTGTTSPGAGTQTAAGTYPPIGDWDGIQVGNAAAIITTGATRGLPARAWVIAVATAMQESNLRNLDHGDRDSVGLFQQRPSQGWGTPAQLLDPGYAAGKFYERLVTVDGWQTMPLTDAAQAVQRSAYPDAYAIWEPDATTIVEHVTGLAACTTTVAGSGWTQPVHAHIGSGFRTTDRPGHDGVDLITDRGTPIHAAAAGTVSRVRCNATDTRTGQPWGCDRDGDPTLTRGCGWYVDIDHPGGIVTRYCHMQTRAAVAEGQPVAAGQVIGIVGSTGHSSGPHLHYEVHRTADGSHDDSSGTAVDPVPFMVTVGAPLGR
ncbi:M23 family metallopeptidase [Dactylosporangium sp. NPDC000244]|uniref:M23 family metallopeptidase n=1 Tax=Dactylosporangium sp. NPDC000244 TaxID=3154365 RepID=UPI00332D5491